MPVINFSGIASGIDTNALVQAQIDSQRRVRIEPSETKVQELTETNTALDQLKTLLGTFRTRVEEFTTIQGGGVSKLASSSNESTATAVASNAAQPGIYTISSITSLAKNHVTSFDKNYTSASNPLDSTLGAPTTVAISIGTPATESFSININSTTTLSDFADQFNASTSNANATIINVGTTSSPDYQLVLTTVNSGTTSGSLSVTLNGGANFGVQTSDPATNAQFNLLGISGTITRSSNTINDLIPGLTFQLQDVTTTSTRITVLTDTATTVANVKEIVEAFNDVVDFINENNQIRREEDGEDVENIFGALASTRTDDSVVQTIRDNIIGSSYSAGNLVRIFADFGVTTERDGKLKLDEDKLDEAINSEPSSVSKVLENFAEQVAVTGGTIDNYTRFNGLLDVSIRNNQGQIENLNRRIADAEGALARLEANLRARFSRLESLVGRLQSQQSSLTAALGGLGGGS
jgi:flagellar hook-associated protein 2